MLFRTSIIGILLSIGLVSCDATLYVPTETDAISNNVPLTVLQQGRDTYINACSSCHNLVEPQRLNEEGWKKALEIMKVKAKINDAKKEVILKYVLAKCSPFQKDSFVMKKFEKALPLQH